MLTADAVLHDWETTSEFLENARLLEALNDEKPEDNHPRRLKSLRNSLVKQKPIPGRVLRSKALVGFDVYAYIGKIA